MAAHWLRPNLAHIEYKAHQRRAMGRERHIQFVLTGQTALPGKCFVQGISTGDGACGHHVQWRSRIEVTPIDAEVISGFGKNRLALGTHPQNGEIADRLTRAYYRLVL